MGGIGGVHRAPGGSPSTDVSADLQDLAQTPVIVVCAGAKAILDLPVMLEYLETHGVTVIGYGTDEFPAFYSLALRPASGRALRQRGRSGGDLAGEAGAGAAGRPAGDGAHSPRRRNPGRRD